MASASRLDPLDGRAHDDRDGGGPPQERARRSKLDPHKAFLRGLISEKDDITIEDMRARLRDEHDLMVELGKAYDVTAFVSDPRAGHVMPHIAVNWEVSKTTKPRKTELARLICTAG